MGKAPDSTERQSTSQTELDGKPLLAETFTAEPRIALVRLVVLVLILPLLWLEIIPSQSKMVLTGLTALIGAYILGALILLPRLPYRPRRDLFLTIDILAVTALVYFTGRINSTLLFLFYLPILAAAVRVDVRHAFLSAAAVSLIVIWMWNLTTGGLPSLGPIAYKVGVFTFGSLLMAFFFGILAQETRLSLARASLGRVLEEKLAEATAQVRHRLQELEFFYDLSRRLASATETPDVLKAITEAARQQMDAPFSAIFLYERLGGGLSLAHARGIGAEDLGPIMYACADRLAAGSTGPQSVEVAGGGQWTRAVYVPIAADGRLIGAICSGGREGWTYREQALSGLRNVADQGGVALERAYLLEDLQRLALADPEARLYSREQLDRILRDEIKRAAQLGAPFVLVKLQLVGMAELSTRRGESAVDLVLRRAGLLILESVRRVDVVAQAAGGEFFVLLPMTNAEAARKFATQVHERLRKDVIAAKLVSSSEGPNSTIAIAAFPDDGMTVEELYFGAQNVLV